jgi:probable rRNA maturation factor
VRRSPRGIDHGHVAVAFVGPARIRELNRAHRRRDTATDVLSFPVDAAGAAPGPRELGDVVVCPARTGDLREAVVHGALHLAGLDHETDAGEMFALQREILRARVG